jgi:hypothetical protein
MGRADSAVRRRAHFKQWIAVGSLYTAAIGVQTRP